MESYLYLLDIGSCKKERFKSAKIAYPNWNYILLGRGPMPRAREFALALVYIIVLYHALSVLWGPPHAQRVEAMSLFNNDGNAFEMKNN